MGDEARGLSEDVVDVLVVGAGFGGMYALHKLRGLGFSVRVLERGHGVGGTWYWNRYPGARCDIESLEYSYSFSAELQQDWGWTQRYPTQPEMRAYAEHVADRFDLRPHITFGVAVTTAAYDEDDGCWRVGTDAGDLITARFLVLATGVLSAASVPQFPGQERFRGRIVHTGSWPEDTEVDGLRVGVVGTGSSGIQVVPHLAERAGHLSVFQRTANYSISAANQPLAPEYVRDVKARYPELREQARRSFTGSTVPINRQSALAVDQEERDRRFEERWALGGFAFLGSFDDVTRDPEANRLAARFVEDKIRAAVDDPTTAELLVPTGHPIGSRRICVDTGYHATFNLPHVRLVDVRRAPITGLTEAGLRTADGEEHPLHLLVLATGFDAMTGSFVRIDVRGRGGVTLREKWADGARTYLGLQTAGFPNLFTLTGPGSPAVLCNMFLALEQHVDWVADLLVEMRERGARTVEPTVDAEQDWSEQVARAAERTLYPQADSWYVGANVPGKPRVFLPYAGGVGKYRRICEQVVVDGYRTFVFDADLTVV
ncbi:flavin-containing monooxygenase [Pseudonocardia parietis]|uniref:Cyclohexanone monooxygenase n=1 Tax=Pseudonocardia parietis TaxID=570936 RepID=A0ABS4W0V5_9PSEU|nr:NAD(P)/FAD-dependent oxidoreductase [Pseudonocardia parietis]MBP2369838.1 cyclohexanone monooxygenase [Pseudonocardia parietis]